MCLFKLPQLQFPPMSCNVILLPRRILDGIDRVNHNFLWGTTESIRKIHWVRWHKVTKPKEEGGLGLQTARGRNIAMLAKRNWRLNTEKEAPWAKVLQEKYCNNRRLNAANADKLPCSRTWKAIKKGREVFTQGSMWMVGRDSMLSFWHGKWMKQGPLRHLIQGPLTRGASNWAIKDIMVDSGIDWNRVPFVFPPEIKHVLQATPLSLIG